MHDADFLTIVGRLYLTGKGYGCPFGDGECGTADYPAQDVHGNLFATRSSGLRSYLLLRRWPHDGYWYFKRGEKGRKAKPFPEGVRVFSCAVFW